MPIDKLISQRVKCTICGVQGVGNCNFWEMCSCGWFKEKGGKCNNPIHAFEERHSDNMDTSGHEKYHKKQRSDSKRRRKK